MTSNKGDVKQIWSNLGEDVLWDKRNRQQHKRQFSLESYLVVKCFKEELIQRIRHSWYDNACIRHWERKASIEKDPGEEKHKKCSSNWKAGQKAEVLRMCRNQTWEGWTLPEGKRHLNLPKESNSNNLDCPAVWCKWATDTLNVRCNATKKLLGHSCPSFYCCRGNATAHKASPKGSSPPQGITKRVLSLGWLCLYLAL